MPFNLFHRKKPEEQAQATSSVEAQPQPETPAAEEPLQAASPPVAAPQEEPVIVPEETAQPVQEQSQPVKEQPIEEKPAAEAPSKTYLKAMPLKELADLDKVKAEVENGNIIILKVTPLAQKSIEDVKNAVNDLFQYAESTGGDIARLGEERVVICPKNIRIWREKTPKPVVANVAVPTAA